MDLNNACSCALNELTRRSLHVVRCLKPRDGRRHVAIELHVENSSVKEDGRG